MTRTNQRIFTILFIFSTFCASTSFSQDERVRREDPFDREAMLKRFDADGDGELNEAERKEMRDFIFRSLEERPGGNRPEGNRPQGNRPEGDRPGQPPPGGGRGGGSGRQDLKVVEKFDEDGDGKLNVEERARARVYVKEQGSSSRRRGPRPRGRARSARRCR